MTPAGPSPQPPHPQSPPQPLQQWSQPLKTPAHLSVLLLLSHSPPNPQVVPVPYTHVLSELERPAVGVAPFLPPLEFHLAFRKVVLSVWFVIVGHWSAFHSFLIRDEMGGRYLKRFQGRCCRHKTSVFLNILGPAKRFLLQWNTSRLLSFSQAEPPFIDVYPHKKFSLVLASAAHRLKLERYRED